MALILLISSSEQYFQVYLLSKAFCKSLTPYLLLSYSGTAIPFNGNLAFFCIQCRTINTADKETKNIAYRLLPSRFPLKVIKGACFISFGTLDYIQIFVISFDLAVRSLKLNGPNQLKHRASQNKKQPTVHTITKSGLSCPKHSYTGHFLGHSMKATV